MTERKTKLTDAQRRFAQEYVKDSCATAAAIRAGYRESSARKTGSRLTKDPAVRAEIDRLLEKVQDKALVDAQWVIEQWKAVAVSCMQEVRAYSPTGAPMKGRNGKQVYKMLDANSARNVLADIAKHLKMFDRPEEKTDDSHSGVLLAQPVKGETEWTKEK